MKAIKYSFFVLFINIPLIHAQLAAPSLCNPIGLRSARLRCSSGIKSINAAYTEIKTELEAVKAQLLSANADNKTLSEALNKAKLLIVELESQASRLTEEIGGHVSEKNALSLKTEQLETQVNDLRAQNRLLSDQDVASRKIISNLEIEIAALKEEVKKLQEGVPPAANNKNPILELKVAGSSNVINSFRFAHNNIELGALTFSAQSSQLELHAYLHNDDIALKADDITIQLNNDAPMRWLNIPATLNSYKPINIWQEWCPSKRSSTVPYQEVLKVVNSASNLEARLAEGSYPCGFVLVNSGTLINTAKYYTLIQKPDVAVSSSLIGTNNYIIRGYKAGQLIYTREFTVRNGSYFNQPVRPSI